MSMVVYRATNIETGEIIEGGARDLARKLGVVQNSIYNAVSTQQEIKFVWFISSERKTKPKIVYMPSDIWDEWDRVTEPFKNAIAKARRCGNGN